MRITSTYKGYPVEIKLDGDKLYSCTIKTRYGVEDKEITKKPLDYILYQQQVIIDNYKTLVPPTDIYHQVNGEYKDFAFRSYYSYNTNQLFLRDIYNSKEKKYIKKEDLGFDPHNRNTQELINQFITFVDSKEEKTKPTTYNWIVRKELYKLNLTTHDLIKILTVDESGIPQFYWTPSDKFPEKPNTYSPNWYVKEGSTYFIYNKPVNVEEIKIENYVTGFVNPDGKVIYYDQYL